MRYVIDKNGCWNFTGAIGQDGYGKVSIKDTTFRIHRIMAQLTIKPYLADSEIVAHKCDNPKCINPEHLFITTHQGNIADRDAKGHQAKGETSSLSKLTELAVKEIRKQYSEGKSLSQIASSYPVSPACIHHVVIRKTWKHI